MQLWTEGKVHYNGYRIEITSSSNTIWGVVTGEQGGYRVILIKEGTGILQIGDSLYPIVAPAVYCINDKENIQFIAGDSLKTKSLQFRLSALNVRLEGLIQNLHEGNIRDTTDYQDLWYMESFLERTESYNGSLLLDPSVTNHMEYLFDEIGYNLTVQPDSYWPCRSRSYLLELLFMIRHLYQKSEYTAIPISKTVSGSIRPIIEYLHTNYKQKIKIEELTALFHVNKTTLNQWFNKSTGLSVISYLNQIRMRMAEAMLRNTTLPTIDIMDRIGIRDDGHFIRQFRKYSGYSPAEYRTNYCWLLNK